MGVWFVPYIKLSKGPPHPTTLPLTSFRSSQQCRRNGTPSPNAVLVSLVPRLLLRPPQPRRPRRRKDIKEKRPRPHIKGSHRQPQFLSQRRPPKRPRVPRKQAAPRLPWSSLIRHPRRQCPHRRPRPRRRVGRRMPCQSSTRCKRAGSQVGVLGVSWRGIFDFDFFDSLEFERAVRRVFWRVA